MAFCEEAATWLNTNEKHVVVLHCKVLPKLTVAACWTGLTLNSFVICHQAGKGRAGMMACMLLLRMGFAASATDAIDRYNRERVLDRRGLTVVSQKKWVNYYAAMQAKLSGPGQVIVEPTFVVQKLTFRNTLTAARLPTLRLRIFTLDSDASQKGLLHQEIGKNEFELQQEIRGCVMLEFYREHVNGCMRVKHFKIWFNTYFLNPGTEIASVKSGCDGL
ncbi:unnamed protein product [Phytophthora lilii]|uniref:Unnamed protein product n=1 Tax=Phytophthora lilii TaxID=2077276 RepID=A0A9W6TJ02_9STRA|nr:unnamed protein product [Phytophthora lilii]